MFTIRECDYAGCTNKQDGFTMYRMVTYDQTWYACDQCKDRVEDRTGYCGASCQFGYGCDQSC